VAEINADTARSDLKKAEDELAKWGDRPQDGDYVNIVHRVGWAKARLDAIGH